MYMNHPTYFKELADYYNNSRLKPNDSMRTGVSDLRRQYNDPNSWVHACVNNLQSVFRGKRVLEVACGPGTWTQFLADVAEQVLATDQSPRLLRYAAELKLQNTNWLECDAFELSKINLRFNGVCHFNFINHIPLDLTPEFLRILHDRLEPGSTVFCATQRFRGSPDQPWYQKKDSGDMVSLRHKADGSVIEVIDTYFSEDLLRGLLAGKACRLRIFMNPWWWWATYQIP